MIANHAEAIGVTVEKYMQGNLLKEEIQTRHVEAAYFNLALSARTTGHVMTVDGGKIEASLR